MPKWQAPKESKRVIQYSEIVPQPAPDLPLVQHVLTTKASVFVEMHAECSKYRSSTFYFAPAWGTIQFRTIPKIEITRCREVLGTTVLEVVVA